MQINGENWKSQLMDKPSETNLLIMWQSAECKECRRGITQLAKLAERTKDSLSLPKVAIVDCVKSEHLCQVWVDNQ